MFIERKLLDISSHFDSSGVFNEKGLIADTAAVATEVDKTKRIEDRVHQILLALVQDKVINWPVNKSKDVKYFYSDKTEFDKKESEAGLKIRELLIKGQVDDCFAWISPPGGPYNYEESRLEVGFVMQKMGFKILRSWGIPVKLTPSECTYLFSFFEEFSNNLSQEISSPEDLRGLISIFKTPQNEKLIDFLSHELPGLSKVWNAIKSGYVSEQNRKTKANARLEVKKISHKISLARSPHELIYIGAQIEAGMALRGFNITKNDCGISNTELLSQSPFVFSGFATNRILGTVKAFNSSENVGTKILCCTCPFCNTKVEAEIYNGEIHCPNCKKSAPYKK